MSIAKGSFEQNHRYDSIDETYIYENVVAPGEEHIAELLPGLGGRVGFVLIEIPVLDAGSPTVVTRINNDLSEDIFDETNTAPSTQQFKINYLQEDSIVYLPTSEVGNKFRVQYKCKGTGQNVENIKTLMRSTIEFNTGLAGKFKKANLYDKVVNAANVYLLGKRATMRNCLVQGSSVIRGNVSGKTSFFEVYGDLTLERDSVTEMSGVVLIIHGSLNVTGAGANPILKGVDGVVGSAGSAGIAGNTDTPRTPPYPDGGEGGLGGVILEMPVGLGVGGNGGGGGGAPGLYYSIGLYAALPGSGAGNGTDGTTGTDAWGSTGVGGVGSVGGIANLLFGAGVAGDSGQNGSYDPYTNYNIGGNGGDGGASGGAGLFIIVFGDIDSDIDFVTGKGINGSQSGPFTLVSNFDSILNTVDVTADTGGVDGVIDFINIQERSDANEHLLTQFGYFEAESISI
jgi:hypothetical protein